ncbi:FecR family protein [Mucilaginibacter mali]|uniref:FecR family protein n=1 Tax=Mucilaginibacter mali TaxID=2740462 RepID=A0A7D4Q4K6_9SPHI|nr:FecR family protein [Mucilaginibacter mali]QKJ31047.1 FecR family protein [Mucilaginibacter mali]
MNEKRLQQLLISFAENRISREEYDELMELIHQTHQNEALYEAMDSVWKEIVYHIPVSQPQRESVYDRIINDPRFLKTPPAVNSRLGLFKKNWLKVAASLLIAGTVGIAGYKLFGTEQAAPVAYLQYAVPAGHHAQFQFPDGTVVAVNAGSILKYPKDFTGKTREVFLQGEAFFDVAHDAARPFIVHTGSIKTQVLGTAFDIEAYGNKKLNVTVARGKVSVLEGSNKLGILTPNHKLTYNYQNKKAEEFLVNANDAIGWKDGSLILNNLNIQEAAEIIERWYNVKFDIKALRGNQTRFSASFLKKESLEKVLNVLSRLNAFHYTISASGDVKTVKLTN